MGTPEIDDELFWDLAGPMIASGRVVEGELMRSRCLRIGKEFLAMPEYRTGDLVVKLPRERVDELIATGVGWRSLRPRRCFVSGCRCRRETRSFGASY